MVHFKLYLARFWPFSIWQTLFSLPSKFPRDTTDLVIVSHSRIQLRVLPMALLAPDAPTRLLSTLYFLINAVVYLTSKRTLVVVLERTKKQGKEKNISGSSIYGGSSYSKRYCILYLVYNVLNQTFKRMF